MVDAIKPNQTKPKQTNFSSGDLVNVKRVQTSVELLISLLDVGKF